MLLKSPSDELLEDLGSRQSRGSNWHRQREEPQQDVEDDPERQVGQAGTAQRCSEHLSAL